MRMMKRESPFRISHAILLLAALCPACSDGPQLGSAALEIRWTIPDGDLRGDLSGIVDTVRVTVSHADEQLVQASFPYENYGATVSNIPAGEERTFLVEASAAETVVYHGTTTGVTIVGGHTVSVPVQLSPGYTADIYPPAAVEDLSAEVIGTTVRLSWTASGDDGMVGRAGGYDLRYADAAIDEASFGSATPIAVTGSPVQAHETETVDVEGLGSGTFHFALKVLDDAEPPNASAISNGAQATVTAGDDTPPAAITDLAVVDAETTGSSVSLTWTAPGDDGSGGGAVAEYDVRYSTVEITDLSFGSDSQAAGPAVPVAPGLAETVRIDGLTEGQTYYFAVKAGDEVPNWAPISNAPVSATPMQAPAQIALYTLAVGETSVTLGWLAPADDGASGDPVTRYEICHSASDIATFCESPGSLWASPPAPLAPGQEQSVEITGLASLQPHYFAAVAYDELDNVSPMSNVIVATPGEQDDVPPDPVGSLSVDAVTQTSVTLSWTAPADDGASGDPVTRYLVRWSTSPITTEQEFDGASDFPGPAAPLDPGQTEHLEVTSLTQADVLHYFAVKAVDNVGNESSMETVSATPTDDVPPAAVTSLNASVDGENEITLIWIAPGDDGMNDTVSGYLVRQSTAPILTEQDFDAADAIPGPNPPYSMGSTQETMLVENLTRDTTYYFAVKAYDDYMLESPTFAATSAITDDATPPDQVTDLAVQSQTADSVTLVWTAVGDDGDQDPVDSYDVRYAASPIPDETAFGAATPVGGPGSLAFPGLPQTLLVQPLNPGQYYFALEALDNRGNVSPLSNDVPVCISCPQIADVRPASAAVGAIVYVSGQDFGAASGTLTIGGQAASVISWDDGLIAAAVPALTGGQGALDVEVTDSGGLVGSAAGAFQLSPWIQSTAYADPALTLTGTGFGAAQGSSVIVFTSSASSPTATTWSDTQIEVDVPGDADSGPVQVVVDGLSSNTPELNVSGQERAWQAAAAWRSGTAPCFCAGASDNSGLIQMAWSEDLSGSREIMGNNWDGTQWGAGYDRVNETDTGFGFSEVAADPAGDFHVAWFEDSTSRLLYRGKSSGIWNALPAEVIGDAVSAQFGLEALPDGTIVAVWSSGDQTRLRYNLRSGAFSAAAAQDVEVGLTGAGVLATAVDPAGMLHAVAAIDTALQHYFFDGSAWWDAGVVAGITTDSLNVHLDLAADGLGQLHLVWWDDSDYAWGLWDGTWTTGLLDSTTGPAWPSVAVDAGGCAHALVELDDGTHWGAYYYARSPGQAWSAGLDLASALGGDTQQPCLVATPDLKVWAFWTLGDEIDLSVWE
ncbi:MAG: fibronectin type III domain-containing protein [Deltaproteobacteria bacterium]|nr:fibronectin type III domain-containing protein [Deltaproteobacteria bacterium]